jgi:hypothetical protein
MDFRIGRTRLLALTLGRSLLSLLPHLRTVVPSFRFVTFDIILISAVSTREGRKGLARNLPSHPHDDLFRLIGPLDDQRRVN